MAAESTHTVFGFGCELDWRPTVFLDGVSSNRKCSACGVVPSTIALLSCRHVLCQPCYDRCVASDSQCCLDGDAIRCDEVVWSTFSTESVLRRKILCWNASNGCHASGPASEILDHFYKKCEHHVVACQRCGQTIAHKDVVSHMSLGLCSQPAAVESLTSANIDSGAAQLTASLEKLSVEVSSFQSYFERRIASLVDSWTAALTSHCPTLESIQSLDNTIRATGRLSREILMEIGGSLQAKLNADTTGFKGSLQEVKNQVHGLMTTQDRIGAEAKIEVSTAVAGIKQCIKTLTESCLHERNAMRQELLRVEKSICNRVQIALDTESHFAASYKELSNQVSSFHAACELLLDYQQNTLKSVDINIDSWSQLKEKSKEQCTAQHFAEKPEYFYGYCIHAGVQMETSGDAQSLDMAFFLEQGNFDQLVSWPMKKKVCLLVLHPTQKDGVRSIFLDTALWDLPGLGRAAKKHPGILSGTALSVSDLEKDGFIKDDKVTLKFEVMP
ncbi:TNF receptor-associated factor 3-like [Haemaphysalis longicornis]